MSTRPLLGDLPDTTRRIAWIMFLTVASLAFSRVFASAAPFAALATLAALDVRRPDAYILTGLVWLANQAAGFGLLHYPRTVVGAAIGFLAAFVVYEAALYAAAFVLPSGGAAFSLATIGYVLEVNAGALALLVALSLGAGAIGLAQPVPVAASRR